MYQNRAKQAGSIMTLPTDAYHLSNVMSMIRTLYTASRCFLEQIMCNNFGRS